MSEGLWLLLGVALGPFVLLGLCASVAGGGLFYMLPKGDL